MLRRLLVWRWLVEELPSVGAIELAHLYRRNELRIKVSQVDAVLGTWFEFEWLPVRNTAAGSATNGPQSPVALDVFGSVLGVPFNLDRPELEVDPGPTDAATQ